MIAKRMSNFAASATGAIVARVAELRAQGQDIISLNVGEPDFPTPQNVKEAGILAINENKTKYTANNGIVELRQSVCDKLKADNGLNYTPKEVCITVGAKQAIFNSVMCVAEKGDEVILPIPCWVSYTEIVKIADATPVFVEVDKENNFDLDIEAIKKAITPRTRAILICTPNNPSGAVYSEAKLRELAELAVKHDFWIIADEIYEKLIYDGEKHFSIASISQDVWNHTLTVNGMSKAYAMTGWRLGYVAGPEEAIAGIVKLQSQVTSNADAIAQYASVEALTGPQETIDFMVGKFDERRKYLVDRLNAMPGVSCQLPKGAFYALPDVSGLIGKTYNGKVLENAIDVTAFLLEAAHIAVVPGDAFYIPNHIRIAYSNSLENIKRAMDQMEAAIGMLNA
ncbi:MAG: pyridoxal phosphate-dependent aminotransferase [Phascolarctobacterium sp.]|nr:pyridoxal phosphate-dependent aminotransferase [Phascolarctobacterium sp.]